MQARGALMVEHRLIERMIRVIGDTAAGVEATHVVDVGLIDLAVDFLRTYADRTHHGKEEDILFKALAERELADGDRGAMEALIQDHVTARRTVAGLVEATAGSREGEG